MRVSELGTPFLSAALLLPVFFLIDGTLYHQTHPSFDSGGVLSAVPLPVSILACYAGILIVGAYRKAQSAILFGLTFAAVMLTTSLAVGISSQKAMLFVQLLLPVGGLVLGQMFEWDERSGITWLAVALAIISLQAISAFVRYGEVVFDHDVFLFSIYQHRQYVPLVLVAAFSMALVTLRRPAVPLLIVGWFAGMSLSFLAIGLFLTAISFCAAVRRSISLVVLGIAGLALGLAATSNHPLALDKARFEQGYTPPNVYQRLQAWRLYGDGVLETTKAFLLGHEKPIDRSVVASAHNYYLDVSYNFGAFAMLPMAALIAYTAWLALAVRPRDHRTVWLMILVAFLLLADNNLKVSLRQPYPGIFTYFLWGLLLARLESTSAWRLFPEHHEINLAAEN